MHYPISKLQLVHSTITNFKNKYKAKLSSLKKKCGVGKTPAPTPRTPTRVHAPQFWNHCLRGLWAVLVLFFSIVFCEEHTFWDNINRGQSWAEMSLFRTTAKSWRWHSAAIQHRKTVELKYPTTFSVESWSYKVNECFDITLCSQQYVLGENSDTLLLDSAWSQPFRPHEDVLYNSAFFNVHW